MGKIATHLHKPVFEIEAYPERELSFWAAFFSIQANGDRPIMKSFAKPPVVTTEQSIAAFKKVFS